MNYFAHALPFLDRPMYAAGTAVPDWLAVVDRRVRLRTKHVRPFVGDSDPTVAELAGGICQHLDDDARFHGTRPFVETVLQVTVKSRDALEGETGFRPGLLGHLLVELLVDALLVADYPEKVERYYQLLDALDPTEVQRVVNRMALRQTDRLDEMIIRFCRARVLWDYNDDGKLMVRLNQVMRRVKLDELPTDYIAVLPYVRDLVDSRYPELLEGMPAASYAVR